MIKTTTTAALSSLFIATQALAFSAVPTAENDNTAIAGHQQSWAYQALAKQNLLDNAVPISEGFRIMAHNAFNSSAYGAIHIDPNHSLSITEQLDTGVRYLELDAHWITQVKDIPFGKALLLCHAGSDHVGCSGSERYLKDAVEEINDWLRKNPRDVVGIMIQNEVEGQTAEVVKAFAPLHDLIYKAEPRSSEQSIYSAVQTLSEETILKAGKQVFIMTSIAGDFTPYSYSGSFNGMGDPKDFNPSEADCLADTGKQKTHHRIFDDGTKLGGLFSNTGRIDDAIASKAARCGASVVAPDHLTIGDSRVKATIWSWAENEPSGGDAQDCGFVRSNGRYYDGSCSNEGSYYVCSDGPTNWKVTNAYGDWSDNADAKCKAEFGNAYSFSMPTNSQQNEWLKIAMNGKPHAWVNYSDQKEEGLWLTSAHSVDYSDGIADIAKMEVGRKYNFFMKSVIGACELEWNGGDTGAGERNAKFDCASKGDPLVFVPVTSASTTSSKPSIEGYIRSQAGGYMCGLEWDSGLDNNERNAKFDCSSQGDLMKIISDSDGTTASVRISTLNDSCGLQWAGGDAEDNERNAKFDCDPAWDSMRLYGISIEAQK